MRTPSVQVVYAKHRLRFTMLLLFSAAAAALLALASAQDPFIGKCPEIKYQPNFDVTQYFVGTWYEQRRFFAIFEIGQKCVEAEYKILPNGYVQVNNSGFVTSKGERVNQLGQAYCDKDQPASCHVKFFANESWAAYNVLSTDYSSYTVIYSCSSLSANMSTQFGWILTRQPSVDASVIEHAMEVFKSNGIDPSRMETVAQDCRS